MGEGPLPPQFQRDQGSPVRLSDLMALGEWLREDARNAAASVREDARTTAAAVKEDLDAATASLRREMQDSHQMLKAAISEVAQDVAEFDRKSEGWQTVHAQRHILDDDERKVWRDKLDTFFQAQEIAKARRDGILGVVRYLVDLVGKNWRGIVALGAAVGVLIGNIHVSVGP